MFHHAANHGRDYAFWMPFLAALLWFFVIAALGFLWGRSWRDGDFAPRGGCCGRGRKAVKVVEEDVEVHEEVRVTETRDSRPRRSLRDEY